MSDRSLYLSDANGTVYLAEPVDVFADDDDAELYRLTPTGESESEPETEASVEPESGRMAVPDLMAALEESLARLRQLRDPA